MRPSPPSNGGNTKGKKKKKRTMDADLSTLTLYLSDSSSDGGGGGGGPEPCAHAHAQAQTRQQKLQQTEASFQLQKAAWAPKDDIFVAASTLALSAVDLATSPAAAEISVPALKAKAEREYYLRRYPSVVASATEALRRIAVSQEGSPPPSVRASEEDKRDLMALLERCAVQLQNGNEDASGKQAFEA